MFCNFCFRFAFWFVDSFISLQFCCWVCVKLWKRVMAGGGGAPAPKIDEPQPHPPKDQLPNVSYCITSPPPWRELFFFFFFHHRFRFSVLLTLNLILLLSFVKHVLRFWHICLRVLSLFFLNQIIESGFRVNSFLLGALMIIKICCWKIKLTLKPIFNFMFKKACGGN